MGQCRATTLLAACRVLGSVRRALAFVSFVLVAAFVAGCVNPTPSEATTAAAMDPDAALLAFLKAAPAPDVNGKNVDAWLAKFVEDHHPRLTGTPGEKAAGDDLEAQLKALGYQTSSKKYGANGLPSLDGPVRAILGVKKGTTHPDELIILGGHYDTAPAGRGDATPVPVPVALPAGGPPQYAAYDNGSGTAMVLEMARLLRNATTERTLVFALFNGEEEGLLASKAYVEDLKASGAKVVTYMGFDMVGINWPSPGGCLCIYAGKLHAKDLNPVQEAVAFDLLGYPRGNATVQVFDNHDTRNSDEGAFATAQFPTMRWAGIASAAGYWGYHRMNDTMETIHKQAGSAELFQQGLEAASTTVYYTVLALDHEGPAAAKPT